MYAPPIGRWLSEDPAGYIDGPNQYLYVANDPINKTDPSGRLFGFNYGKFCGWSNRASCPPGTSGVDPIDALDAACEVHDCCQDTWWTCNPYHVIKCSVQLCLSANDAEKKGCDTSPDPKACRIAAGKVQLLFCALGLTNPNEPIFPTDSGYSPWPRGPKF